MTGDLMRTIEAVEATGPSRLRLAWSDGETAEVDLAAWLKTSAFAPLCDPAEFAKAEVGDLGHSLAWPSGAEAGADALWLETLSATGGRTPHLPSGNGRPVRLSDNANRLSNAYQPCCPPSRGFENWRQLPKCSR
jgi:hypothetical protein